ncbi:MAG TPA: tetratricopeptide repeat protein [Longimicrobiales bacterium]
MIPVRRWCTRAVVALATLAVAPGGGSLYAQAVASGEIDEVAMLRAAADREVAGDLAGAEQILLTVLDEHPGSLSALLSLERVLRMSGRLEALLPPLDALLAVDPSSPIGNQMRIRTLLRLNRPEAMARAAEAWMDAEPELETPYREIASILLERGDPQSALKVLTRGRSAVKRDDALALELGEAYAALGDYAHTVEEWSRAVGEEGEGFSLVRRRLSALPDGGARIVPRLIEALTTAPTTPGRQRAAAELAIDAGLDARAEAVARAAAAAMVPAERSGFLIEMARRADGAHLPRLAYWAYTEIVASGGPAPRLVALQNRLGELALMLGDTVTAREHFAVVEGAYAPGTPERRQATAVRIRLTAREEDVEDAVAGLATFREMYPEAPELDELSAAIGDVLLSRGDATGAERVIAGIRGPRTSLLRSRIALQSGKLAQARAALLAAAPLLHGEQATRTILLATLLGRLSPEGGALLERALAEVERGHVEKAIEILADESDGLARPERSAILDFAADLADREELPLEAERIRRTLVMDFADMQEAPAALLALGRALAARPDQLEEARHYLERLVLDYPQSALVPQARRELDRLRARIPRS